MSTPLYLGGKRREGPNRWGFDPFLPCLEPPRRADNAHHINREGSAFWSSPETLRARLRLVHQIARRKRVGTRAEPVRRRRGVYETADLEVRTRDMYSPAAEGLFRLLSWIAWHTDWRSSRIGLWIGGRLQYQSRCSLADRAGFPVRVDSRGRVRADRLDRRIEDAIAAGFVWRHEEDGVVAFKVTRLFWIVCGVQGLREQYGQRLKRAARKHEAAAKARLRAEQREATSAALVEQLARARANDTDFTARAPSAEEAARLRAEHGIARARSGGEEPPT